MKNVKYLSRRGLALLLALMMCLGLLNLTALATDAKAAPKLGLV